MCRKIVKKNLSYVEKKRHRGKLEKNHTFEKNGRVGPEVFNTWVEVSKRKKKVKEECYLKHKKWIFLKQKLCFKVEWTHQRAHDSIFLKWPHKAQCQWLWLIILGKERIPNVFREKGKIGYMKRVENQNRNGLLKSNTVPATIEWSFTVLRNNDFQPRMLYLPRVWIHFVDK